MFQTNKAAEIHIPVELSNDEIQAWSFVKYQLHMYWFQVTYTIINDDGDKSSDTIFISDLDYLLYLKNSSEINLYDVYLVSPNQTNGGKCWKMELLKEIHIGYEPDPKYEQEALIFTLDNGDRYVHSYMDSDEDDLTRKELIFETTNHSV